MRVPLMKQCLLHIKSLHPWSCLVSTSNFKEKFRWCKQKCKLPQRPIFFQMRIAKIYIDAPSLKLQMQVMYTEMQLHERNLNLGFLNVHKNKEILCYSVNSPLCSEKDEKISVAVGVTVCMWSHVEHLIESCFTISTGNCLMKL